MFLKVLTLCIAALVLLAHPQAADAQTRSQVYASERQSCLKMPSRSPRSVHTAFCNCLARAISNLPAAERADGHSIRRVGMPCTNPAGAIAKSLNNDCIRDPRVRRIVPARQLTSYCSCLARNAASGQPMNATEVNNVCLGRTSAQRPG